MFTSDVCGFFFGTAEVGGDVVAVRLTYVMVVRDFLCHTTLPESAAGESTTMLTNICCIVCSTFDRAGGRWQSYELRLRTVETERYVVGRENVCDIRYLPTSTTGTEEGVRLRLAYYWCRNGAQSHKPYAFARRLHIECVRLQASPTCSIRTHVCAIARCPTM